MRNAGWLAGIAGALALAGCGGEGERFSEGKIEDAAKVEDGTVGGDPFCEVSEVLKSADAISKAESESAGDIITSKVGNVGVVVVPPFPDDCEEIVHKGLNQLDPPEKPPE
ncbi:MAG: hypothetical protein ACR2G3_06095 [Solirubrobacterales bacterium]